MSYYLHWPLGEILDLAHPDRIRVIAEIGDIHNQLRALEAPAGFGE